MAINTYMVWQEEDLQGEETSWERLSGTLWPGKLGG
jgi:hypothetical protein